MIKVAKNAGLSSFPPPSPHKLPIVSSAPETQGYIHKRRLTDSKTEVHSMSQPRNSKQGLDKIFSSKSKKDTDPTPSRSPKRNASRRNAGSRGSDFQNMGNPGSTTVKEGDVVVVTGKLDERISDAKEGDAIGTVVMLSSAMIWVLLSNGNIWSGSPKLVYLMEPEDE